MPNEVQEGNDKAERFDQGDRTSENTVDDAVIGGGKKHDHQKRQKEMANAGKDWTTHSDNEDDQSMLAMEPGETKEQYQARLEERQKQETEKPKIDSFGIDYGGFVETAKGKITKNGGDGTSFDDNIRIAENSHEKLNPRDGQELSLDLVLNNYRTSFTEAYEDSKQLKPGAAGKLSMLEETIARLESVPWKAKLKIKFDSSISNPEYDPIDSRITINSKHGRLRQIEEFVHESFHATHQSIGALYINKAKPVSPEVYFNERTKGEVGSFIAEIRVNTELKNPSPVEFEHVVNGKIVKENLTALYKNQGEEGLRNFLLDARPPLIVNGRAQLDFFQNLQTRESYREHYQRSYESYKSTFYQAKPQAGAVLRDYQEQNPGKTSEDFINEGY